MHRQDACATSGGRQLLRFLAVPLLEALDATGGIHKLLRASKEGMALGANANAHVVARGTGLDDVATRAMNHGVHVFRMYLGFHDWERQKVAEE
jgi:hypothetical protein